MDGIFDEKRMALIFKALSDENRVKILELLGSEETCACVLLSELSISQPTLSHHMSLLVQSGLVTAQKDGRWMKYRKNDAGFAAAALCVEFLRADGENRCSCSVS